jgi:hypothetical protein
MNTHQIAVLAAAYVNRFGMHMSPTVGKAIIAVLIVAAIAVGRRFLRGRGQVPPRRGQVR